MKDTYCSFCGSIHSSLEYPKTCHNCNRITYLNPSSVAVAVIPCNGGVIAVRRNVEPFIGQLAFPGGNQEVGETLEEAVVREVKEETGIELSTKSAHYIGCRVVPDRALQLVFFAFPPVIADDFSFSNEETMAVEIIDEQSEKLCFPIHQEFLDKFFKKVD